MPVLSCPLAIAVVLGAPMTARPGPVIVEVDSDEVGGNLQADAGGPREREIVDELIRTRLIDRAAFLDLGRAFSCVLCLPASPRREDYHPEGERNWKKRCSSSHVSSLMERYSSEPFRFVS
jgi:hypothetical protein